MFHGHLDCFQIPPLGGRPNTKPVDHDTPNIHNRSFILFYHVWEPAWIKIHWNSIWLRARSHTTSHNTWGPVTTLHDFGVCCDDLWTLFFWALTISWSWLSARVWSGPKPAKGLAHRLALLKPEAHRSSATSPLPDEAARTCPGETWPPGHLFAMPPVQFGPCAPEPSEGLAVRKGMPRVIWMGQSMMRWPPSRALHRVSMPMPKPTHAHGFWVGMGLILLSMGGHGWA